MSEDRKMRAKLRVGSVIPQLGGNEAVTFHGVAKNGSYPEDGSDENNTFAKFTPSANFSIVIANPELIGKFEVGQTFYVDFTPAPT